MTNLSTDPAMNDIQSAALSQRISVAAPQRGAAAGVEVIRCGGVAHIQIKMSVRVNKTGEQKTAGYNRLGPGLTVTETDGKICRMSSA